MDLILEWNQKILNVRDGSQQVGPATQKAVGE